MTGPEPYGDDPTVSFAFNLAKIPDHGEDSDPILRDGPDLGLVAVFDGMGGAGGTVYDTPDGPRSGAWLAARIARDVVEQRMLTELRPDRPLPGDATAEALHDALVSALRSMLTELDAPVSRLRSRLLRALPTTMALGAVQRSGTDGDGWLCHVFWAGDSRVFALDETGLHQLSSDDLRDPGDAMANLQRDSVISNAICADAEFQIHHRQLPLTAPFALVCATDGCFGYLRSPMHFEQLVLQALADADSEAGWSTNVRTAIAAVTGDDASMAVLAVGTDLAGLQELLAPRSAEMSAQYTAPMDALTERVAVAEQTLADLLQRRGDDTALRWQRYRDGYERLMRGDADETPPPRAEAPQRPVWNPAKPIASNEVPRPAAVGSLESDPDSGGSDADDSDADDADANGPDAVGAPTTTEHA